MTNHGARMWRLSMAGTIALALISATTEARAQDRPDVPSASRGEALADKLCASCHLMPHGRGPAPTVGVLTMRAIANKPGQTVGRIEATMLAPHPPMPDTRPSIRDIKDILQFLETLRTDPAIPPLAPPVPGERTKSPSPS